MDYLPEVYLLSWREQMGCTCWRCSDQAVAWVESLQMNVCQYHLEEYQKGEVST